MDMPGPQAQSRKRYSPFTRHVPGNGQSATTIANQLVPGYGGFMKTSCEIKKPASHTWPWGVLWLFALSLILNTAAAPQDTITELNLHAEKPALTHPPATRNPHATARVHV